MTACSTQQRRLRQGIAVLIAITMTFLPFQTAMYAQEIGAQDDIHIEDEAEATVLEDSAEDPPHEPGEDDQASGEAFIEEVPITPDGGAESEADSKSKVEASGGDTEENAIDKSVEEGELLPSFEFDLQPEGPVADPAGESLPRWKFDIDADWVPDGWELAQVTDGETGVTYWTLEPAAAMAVVADFEALKDAIHAAADGDVIEIANDISFTGAITVSKSLTLKSAAGDVSLIVNSSAYRHFIVTGGEVSFTTKGVALNGSNRGGGIRSEADHLILDAVIVNCVSMDTPHNQGGTCGGGVYISRYNQKLTVTGGKICNNSAAYAGGGIYGLRSNITITGGEISGNTAKSYGGGVYNYSTGATVSISGAVISNNTADSGGGIHTGGESLTITGGKITENKAKVGGGINNKAAVFTVEDGEISRNTAEYGGGIHSEMSRTVTAINGGKITDNTATEQGGGIYFGTTEARLIIDGGKITGNSADGHGGGIFARANTEIYICGGEITDNITGSNGGGIYATKLENLEIRGGAVVKDNQAAQAYYLSDPNLIALHGQKIDPTVTWTSGFRYIYNNLDVNNTKGSTTPPVGEEYIVTVVQTYADGSQTDITDSYTVAEGEPFHVTFTVPASYEAGYQATDPDATVDVQAGTIDIAAVTGDVTVTITYTSAQPGEGHNVTIVTRYLDSALPEDAKTYLVPHGDSFSKPYEMLEGYEVVSVGVRSLNYFIDQQNRTVNIDSVTYDVTITLTFDRAYYNVTIIVRYHEGSRDDHVEVHQVDYGKSLNATFPVEGDYLPTDLEMDVAGFEVNLRARTVYVSRVLQDMTCIIHCI